MTVRFKMSWRNFRRGQVVNELGDPVSAILIGRGIAEAVDSVVPQPKTEKRGPGRPRKVV